MVVLVSLVSNYLLAQRDSSRFLSAWKPQLELGTGGLGVSLDHELTGKLKLMTGLRWMGYQKVLQIDLENESVLDVDPDIQRLSAGVSLRKAVVGEWLSLEGGADVYVLERNRLVMSTETGFDSGGLQIAAEDFGRVEFGMNWWKAQPYLGLRFGGQGADKLISVSGLIGCWYMGSPKLDIHYSGFLETTNLSEDIRVIEKNMEHYSFFPRLALNLTWNR